MSGKSLVVKGYTAAQISSLLRSDEHFVIGMRLYAVYLVSCGKSSRKLEELYDTSFKQITNWVHRFEKYGIDGLRDKSGRGRKCSLSKVQLGQLKNALKVSPVKFGTDADVWNGPLVGDWLFQTFGVSFKRAQIYKIVNSLGFVFQKGRGFVSVQ